VTAGELRWPHYTAQCFPLIVGVSLGDESPKSDWKAVTRVAAGTQVEVTRDALKRSRGSMVDATEQEPHDSNRQRNERNS